MVDKDLPMILPLVYMAGPYTKPDPVENTHKAMKRWEALRIARYCTPICPHWSMAQHLVTPREYQYWMNYDYELIRHVSALIRYPGESAGADSEVEFAKSEGIPVFDNEKDLKEWCETWIQFQNDPDR
jgi:hypothetical protein